MSIYKSNDPILPWYCYGCEKYLAEHDLWLEKDETLTHFNCASKMEEELQIIEELKDE